MSFVLSDEEESDDDISFNSRSDQGGDYSDDGDYNEQPKRKRKKRATKKRKGAAAKTKKAKTKRAKKSAITGFLSDSESDEEQQDEDVSDVVEHEEEDEEEEDDEEVREVPMDDDDDDESDVSDDMDPNDPYGDGYGEDFIGDENDRQYIYSLPEVKREEILYNRRLERERIQERRESKRQSRAFARKRGKRGKTQEQTERFYALSDLAYQRTKQHRSVLDGMDLSDEDDDGEEGGDSASRDARGVADITPRKRMSRKRKKVKEEEALITELIQPAKQTPLTAPECNRFLLARRAALAKIIDEPYFEDYVRNKLVRLASRTRSGKSIYIVAQIVGFEERSQYKFEGTVTKRRLVLARGKDTKSMRMDVLSNHSIKESEFDEWCAHMNKQEVPVPTEEQAKLLYKRAQKMREEFQYTPDIVEKMVKQKKNVSFKHTNIPLERYKLNLKRDAAIEAGDNDQLKEVMKELDALEEYSSRVKALEAARRSTNVLEVINKKNAAKNLKVVDEQAVLEAKSSVHQKKKKKDPFRRKITRPTVTWVSQDGSKSKQSEPSPKSSKPPPVDVDGANAAKNWMASPTPTKGETKFTFGDVVSVKQYGVEVPKGRWLEDEAWMQLIRANQPQLNVDLSVQPPPPPIHRSPATRFLSLSKPHEHFHKVYSQEEYFRRIDEAAAYE